MWHLAAINAQRLFQSVACMPFNDVHILWPLYPVLLVDMQRLYLQADIQALKLDTDRMAASNAVLQQRAEGAEAAQAALQQRTEDAEAAKATLEEKVQAADDLCSSVQMSLHESEQAMKSLRCQLNEQEQVAQVRRQLSL